MFPDIRIRYNDFLDAIYQDAFAFRAAQRPGLMTYPSGEEVERKAALYREQWKAHGKCLLAGMCDFLGLHFSQAVINVHVVGGGVGAFSNPVVIAAHFDPDRFVDILAHELLHRLLAEPAERGDIWAIVREKFPYEWVLTKNHILVNCAMAYLYKEVFEDDSRLVRDVEASEQQPAAYKKSWEIVLGEGYRELVRKFQDDERWPRGRHDGAPASATIHAADRERDHLLRCMLHSTHPS